MSTSVREPAVAGMFYPAERAELQRMLKDLLDKRPPEYSTPKALIVPHAGYVFSGAVAATAYTHLLPLRDTIERVVLLGPSHRVPLRGLAAPTVDRFATPLGKIALDRQALASLERLPQVSYRDDAHRFEHSLEVHLPFLQTLLGNFSLVPLVVGQTPPEQVAEVLRELWGGKETLIVISTDLSHFLSYEDARARDRNTTTAIEHLDATRIRGEDACGCFPLNGLLELARESHLKITTLDLRNSGDTAGPRDQVVGYGSWLVTEDERGNA